MRIKILSIMIFFIIIATVSYADIATKAKVSIDSTIRVREEATIDSEIVTTLEKDDEVEILDTAGDWYKIQYKDDVGYAKAEFFEITQEGDSLSTSSTSTENTVNDTPEDTSNENSLTENNTVTETSSTSTETSNTEISQSQVEVGQIISISSDINLRIIPSYSARKIENISAQTAIQIDSIYGNWCKISANGIYGWVTKNDLLKDNTAQETTQQSTETEQTVENNVTEN